MRAWMNHSQHDQYTFKKYCAFPFHADFNRYINV